MLLLEVLFINIHTEGIGPQASGAAAPRTLTASHRR